MDISLGKTLSEVRVNERLSYAVKGEDLQFVEVTLQPGAAVAPAE